MRVFLGAMFAAVTHASVAAPQCDVPNPPPICDGPTIPGDPPAQLLAPPFVNGGGLQSARAFNIAVTPPDIYPYNQIWAGVEIQRAATVRGPWTTWKRVVGPPGRNIPLTLGQGYYFLEQYAGAPPSQQCVRAKVWLANQTSEWSEPKCMSVSALPGGLGLSRTNAGVVATWNDTSITDQAYVVEYWTNASSSRVVISGTGGVTGSMQALLPGVNGLSLVCVAIYAIEPYPEMWRGGYSSGGTLWLPQFLFGSPLARLNNPLIGCSFGV